MHLFNFRDKKIDKNLIEGIQSVALIELSKHFEISLHHLMSQLTLAELEPFDTFDLSIPHDLFIANFLTQHALYLIDLEMHGFQGNELVISGSQVRLVTKENQLDSALSEGMSMRSYYLDLDNLWGSSNESASELISDFWQRYRVYESADAAWATLGLQATASVSEIKHRYKKLAQLNHPDKGGNPVEFAELTAAKNTLLRIKSKSQ